MVIGSVVPLTMFYNCPKGSAEVACILREMGYYCAVMIGYNLGVIMG